MHWIVSREICSNTDLRRRRNTSKKIGSIIIIILNILGILCLVYYAVMYFMHDTAVVNPNAMIPFQKWESSGVILTIGLIPLAIVNVLAMIFLGKDKIKKPLRVLFLIPSIICLAIVMHYWLTSSEMSENFVGSEPVVRVSFEDKDTHETQYALIYDDGVMEILEESFEPDQADVFIADVDNFSSATKDGNIFITLENTIVSDDKGNETEADDLVTEVLKNVADTADHDILEAKVFEAGDTCIVAVQTNVNWQDPCEFYMYDSNSGILEFLYSWDNVEVQSIAVCGV